MGKWRTARPFAISKVKAAFLICCSSPPCTKVSFQGGSPITGGQLLQRSADSKYYRYYCMNTIPLRMHFNTSLSGCSGWLPMTFALRLLLDPCPQHAQILHCCGHREQVGRKDEVDSSLFETSECGKPFFNYWNQAQHYHTALKK
jgi:hypothetical protein